MCAVRVKDGDIWRDLDWRAALVLPRLAEAGVVGDLKVGVENKVGVGDWRVQGTTEAEATDVARVKPLLREVSSERTGDGAKEVWRNGSEAGMDAADGDAQGAIVDD